MSTEKIWLSPNTVLALHRRHLAEHGGRDGFDTVRLSAALARPLSALDLSARPMSLPLLAASYALGILDLRPFRCGNERTAFGAAMLFLRLNGVLLTAPLQEKWTVFSNLLQGKITALDFADWMELRYLANVTGKQTVVKVSRTNRRVSKVSVLRNQVDADAANVIDANTELVLPVVQSGAPDASPVPHSFQGTNG